MPTIKHTPQSIAELERERDQYKLQRDELSKKLDIECNDNYKLEGQLNDMTKQRDELIEDVEKLRKSIENYKLAIKELKFGNDALRLQSDEYFNLWQDVEGKYTNLTEHIKLKAENNPSVSRYINLVLYIDDLEGE
ncbi:DUF2226 domain-containing protein [Mammaliicoccus fleurettii]|uniref:DUF2226 domain-containing protein n=1 Tax=Mammaliicoccus fleurettii TaxID=150056 RepID=UPI001AAE0E43|nr:DUF2226 domain-containing protein [Mammaliicoccus fleurettii]MBO3062745.1 DUF2226 domain-containing protein [Mammaliicoccus fleurettii]